MAETISVTTGIVPSHLTCRVCGRSVPVLMTVADIQHKIVTTTTCRDCPRPKPPKRTRHLLPVPELMGVRRP